MPDSPPGSWQRTVLPDLASGRGVLPRRTPLPALMAALVLAACGALSVLDGPQTSPAAPGTAAALSAGVTGGVPGTAVPATAAGLSRAVGDLPPRPLVRRPSAPRRAAQAGQAAAAQTRRVSRSRRAPDLVQRGRYVCPVAGRRHFVDSWGDRRSGGRRHQGTDIMAPYGAPILAVTSGVVRTARSGSGGISLYLRGDDGVEYFYAHNSRNSVRSGERVRAGEVIAYVGSSGNARGIPHLHFERHPRGGRAVNPYPLVARLC